MEQKKKSKDTVQSEVLAAIKGKRRVGAGVSMGVGKTYIGLRRIDEVTDETSRVLVVAPKLSVFDTWKEEIDKWGLQKLLSRIEFTTYLSLNKQDYHKYDLVVLDECHSLLDVHEFFLERYNGDILGLTGTPPRFINSEKGRMVAKYCPIKYSYIVKDAVEDNILNDYRIVVHRLDLDTANNLKVDLKNGRSFYTSEAKNYEFWTDRVESASSPKQKQTASVMRMKAMMEYKSKLNYGYRLFRSQTEKCLIFCNTKDQADKMCRESYHSGNDESEANLTLFRDSMITKMSCVLQLNEGINIPGLKSGIILHSYGNERKTPQRIGRFLRLNPDDVCTVHITCYRNTVDEKWCESALADFDQEKISYVDHYGPVK